MISTQNYYVKWVIEPAAIVDNAALTTAEIDTVVNGVKYDYATIIVRFGAMDIAVSAMSLQQSDTTGSGFADITGTVGGTDFTIPAATADNTTYVYHVDLRGKKRFLDLNLTAGDGAAGTYVTALCLLSRGKETPINATAHGLAVEIIV